MRASRFSLWARLRELLAGRGLTISTTVLVHLFPDGPEAETGVVLSDGGRVYEFDLVYNRMREGSDRDAVIEHWQDITNHWQAHPLRSEIADAFVWRPSARRTCLDLDSAHLARERDPAVLLAVSAIEQWLRGAQ
ncbi:hypothetical protein [Streptomyces sp. NPDC054901]